MAVRSSVLSGVLRTGLPAAPQPTHLRKAPPQPLADALLAQPSTKRPRRRRGGPQGQSVVAQRRRRGGGESSGSGVGAGTTGNSGTPGACSGGGADSSESACFVCGDGGVLLLCDAAGCAKVYHANCIAADDSVEPWHCPRHACCVEGCAQTKALIECTRCPSAFCRRHAANLRPDYPPTHAALLRPLTKRGSRHKNRPIPLDAQRCCIVCHQHGGMVRVAATAATAAGHVVSLSRMVEGMVEVVRLASTVV